MAIKTPMTKPRSRAAAQRMVDDWNRAHRTLWMPVRYWIGRRHGAGQVARTVTRAYVSDAGVPFVMLGFVKEKIPLWLVEPLPLETPSTEPAR